MRQKRFENVGRKGWSVILALCLLAMALAPTAVNAKKPIPTDLTLTELLDMLPNGRPYQILEQAILQLAAQVGTSTEIAGGSGTTDILSNVVPGTKHMRLEASFVPTNGDAPSAGSYIMYAIVSVNASDKINYIKAGGDGLQIGNSATVLPPAIIASIDGIADLQASQGTTGVTFQLVDKLGSGAGKYFFKVIP